MYYKKHSKSLMKELKRQPISNCFQSLCCWTIGRGSYEGQYEGQYEGHYEGQNEGQYWKH